MARKTKPLTDTEIKAAKPKDVDYQLYDGDGCSGQQKLATALEFFQNNLSDSFGVKPPLY
ncbi:hypothetical protein FHW04_004369 [Pantoea sp. AN62]